MASCWLIFFTRVAVAAAQGHLVGMAGVAGSAGSHHSTGPLPDGLQPPLGWWAILNRPISTLPTLRAFTVQLGVFPAQRVSSAGDAAAEVVRQVLRSRREEVDALLQEGVIQLGAQVNTVNGYLSDLGMDSLDVPAAPSSATSREATPPTTTAIDKEKLVLHDDDLTPTQKARSNDMAAAQLIQNSGMIASAVADLGAEASDTRLQAAQLLRKALSTGENTAVKCTVPISISRSPVLCS